MIRSEQDSCGPCPVESKYKVLKGTEGLLPREGISRGSNILKINEEIDKSCGGRSMSKFITSALVVE